jgi:hypothetical protein
MTRNRRRVLWQAGDHYKTEAELEAIGSLRHVPMF